jgi:hypothetical protein
MRLKSYIIAVLMLTGLTSQVSAQRDVTNSYITNAKLDKGTSGWTVSNFNAPEQGNNTEGYASEAYAGWGSLDVTSYSMTQSITLPKGSYRLVNYSFFRQGLRYNTDSGKSLAYLKAGNKQTAIKTLGSIDGIPTSGDNGGYANSQAEGANCFDSKMYRNVVEFEINADNTTIEIGIVGTFDLKQSWCIAGMFELFDLNDAAYVSSPTDVTYAITNPGFEYRNLTGWTANGMVYQDNNWEKKAGIGFAEKWQEDPGLPNASITQQLTSLPNGMYELSVYAHNINQKNGDAAGRGMFLKAGDNQTEIGAFGQYKVRATVTDGTLNIGLVLDGCTGNWIAADRFALSYFGDPDTALLELLEEYITEAEELLASGEAVLLTTAQKADLQGAINNAKAATSENLSDCVDAISAAIQTARQQIQAVKDTRKQMIAALERFENEYNLTDGTDYSRVTMSAGAWTTLIEKVNAVSLALDDVSQIEKYSSLKDALISQMNATDSSLRLFKSYNAMAEGTSDMLGSDTRADGDTDNDYTQQSAINRMNTAFADFVRTKDAPIDMAAFLGENLDFSAPEGKALNTENSNNIHEVTGWNVRYADADTWAVLQTQQSDNAGKLYIRKNWGSAATTLVAEKERMLPAGKYKLTLSWNSSIANMTNLSNYKIGDTKQAIGKAVFGARTLEYEFEISEPQPFDLVIGFQKKNKDNTPAQIIVDDIVLTYSHPDLRGDVNGDNVVNGTDIQAIINLIVEGGYDQKADVNEDGKVNGTDIQEVINIIVNAD